MNSKELCQLIYGVLDEHLAMDIRVIEIGEISTIADYFVIASGKNSNHVRNLAEQVEMALSKEKIEPKQIEENKNHTWILQDYRDVVIHIFDQENRLFYDLERMWRDGKELSEAELKQEVN